MRRYPLDSTPLGGCLRGRVHYVDRLTPLLTRREVATSILVYAEVTEYLKGLPDYDRRREQPRTLLRSVYSFPLSESERRMDEVAGLVGTTYRTVHWHWIEANLHDLHQNHAA